MKYRTSANGLLKLSEIGLGCASYWGKKSFSEREAFDVVHRAIERGVNYFDTGHSYSGEHAERRLGKALNNHQQQDLIISSKLGTRVGQWGRLYKDFSPAWITQSCELSLRRLGVDHLPLLLLHGPNPEDFNDETYRVLEDLRNSGKVGMLGVNSFADEIIELAANSGQFQYIMLDYNILTQQRKQTMDQLHAKNIDVLVAGAIAGGLYDQRFKQFRGMKSVWYWLRAWKNNRTLLQKAKLFEFLNHQTGGSAVQLALAFVLQQSQLTSALIGTTSVKHLDELLDTVNMLPDPEIMSQIAALA